MTTCLKEGLMLKKIFCCFAVTCIFLAATALVVNAFVLLTKEQALKEVFPADFEVKAETRVLEGETLESIKKRLGGSLEFFQEGSESAKVEAETKIEFYFGISNGEKKGVAIIDVQPGKWGPVTFITAMDVSGQVRRVRVMGYEEIRGRPIAETGFMNQYRGKTSTSALEVGRDIVGISGATISSRAATFAVKKAIVMYEEVYLRKK
jgi:Na+-translocating ferredoxin:NAD+ oxidoreductase RnfG subunit